MRIFKKKNTPEVLYAAKVMAENGYLQYVNNCLIGKLHDAYKELYKHTGDDTLFDRAHREYKEIKSHVTTK